MKTLQDWLDWQVSVHPKRMDLGLERVAAVWERLGPAKLPFPIVSVGGTNGKGSCVAMLEAIGLAGGYATASYTSPHLLDYNERVKLSGEAVSDERLCEAFERIEAVRSGIPLTYFEFGTLAALDIFARARPDLAILEVGLGGRLDAVNIVDADVSIVTTIGLDHTAWLGGTLEEIAAEKAGIFRTGRPAIIGQRDAPERLRAEAERIGAIPMQLGREIGQAPAPSGWIFEGPSGRRLPLPTPTLRGAFQLDNAAVAVAALETLHPRLPLAANAVRSGLQRARLPGRFQVIPGDVTRILDVAHNREAAQSLASSLRAFRPAGSLRAVLAVLSDKDPGAIATPLASLVDGGWYLAASQDTRAMSADELATRLSPLPLLGTPRTFASVASAIDAALAASAPGDCLLVLGSFTTVGEAMRHSAGT